MSLKDLSDPHLKPILKHYNILKRRNNRYKYIHLALGFLSIYSKLYYIHLGPQSDSVYPAPLANLTHLVGFIFPRIFLHNLQHKKPSLLLKGSTAIFCVAKI